MQFSLDEMNAKARSFDKSAYERANKRWASIAKPLGSLGIFEETISRIAGMKGSEKYSLKNRRVLVMCADNGVVAQGVTQTGQEVTAIVAGNMTKAMSSVCKMAKVASAQVTPIDIGMIKRVEGTVDMHIQDGTNDFTLGPAMTRADALLAINHGIEMVRRCAESGCDIIVTGEMGIGNTTTSSALASVLLGLSVEEVTGRGAGLSSEGLVRKINAIKKGIEVNAPNKNDALDVLHKLGGFDIAGMAGIFIGGAIYGIPIIIDGLISSVAALVAGRLCPASRDFMLASHTSTEPAAMMILDELKVSPVIFAGMHLGEGTGGVCLLPLIDMVLSVYDTMSTFNDINIDAYTPQV
ncbi:MAG: nicotinate-nucleotide--dimethylbenzimidazole phosphoribosyltransferase [Clostridiales bacterium]|nr:nicotinate-nucleotide--dimethylbenzimidazole phosphoribosyltransferase [Clostridiales bacterium]